MRRLSRSPLYLLEAFGKPKKPGNKKPGPFGEPDPEEEEDDEEPEEDEEAPAEEPEPDGEEEEPESGGFGAEKPPKSDKIKLPPRVKEPPEKNPPMYKFPPENKSKKTRIEDRKANRLDRLKRLQNLSVELDVNPYATPAAGQANITSFRGEQ